MAAPLYTPIVLIVDEDFGFVLWLRQLLVEAGCEVVPTLSCQQALDYAAHLNRNIDLVIVNPHVLGVSAMLHTLGEANRRLRVITLQELDDEATGVSRSAGTMEKPRAWQTLSNEEWFRKIQQVVSDAPLFLMSAATTIFRG